ncbi:CC/Se motif family (seleno)protein [uncultured Halomonas sp.]|uniref:CC/Se motif family (seleno)protein n=1 Tax=uncultured Halomonas sp. TaxID=173971 RepID=UPI002615DC39|nr:CC/Se motif family (seleno)protein [uncultured Halomonas sp.]
MAIAISRRAREFIQRKGSVVTVRLAPRHGCCGGMASLAVADAVEPDDPAGYRHLEREGIRVYLAPELVDEGLSVDLGGWGIFRHLYVDGAPLKR